MEQLRSILGRLRAVRLHAILVMLAIVAGLVCLATIGTALPLSPSTSINLDGPTVADSDGSHTAIVDTESRRILILNANHQLTGIVDCQELNSPIEAVTDVCVAKETLYVAGVKYLENSSTIERERIVAYDFRGGAQQVVYDLERNFEQTPSIKTMENDDDGAYVVMARDSKANLGYSTIEVIRVDRTGALDVNIDEVELYGVHDLGFSYTNNEIISVSVRGVINDTFVSGSNHDLALAEYAFTSIDIADDNSTYLCDDVTSSVFHLTNDGELETIAEGPGYGEVHVNGDTLSVCSREENAVLTGGLDGSDFTPIKSVGFSQALAVTATVVLACRAYLVLLTTIALVRIAWKRIATGQIASVSALVASAAVVFAVSLAITYISYGSYQARLTTRTNEIDAFADYLEATSANLSEDMEQIGDRSLLRDEGDELVDTYYHVAQIEDAVGSLATAATKNGIGTYIVVYGLDEQGVYYLFDNSFERVMGSNGSSSANIAAIRRIFETNASDRAVHSGRTRYDSTLCRLVRIPSADGSRAVGVIEIGSRMRTFESAIQSEQIETILALLVMVMVVYLTYTELRECVLCFVAYRELQHHHDAIAILTRPFSFCVTILSSIDSVMSTLIARSLISSSGLSRSTLMLALPAMMMGVGLALGQAIYSLLGSRVTIRRLMTRGALAMICAALLTAGVVFAGNFWAYCVAKLFMAIPFGLLYTLSYSLPRRADTDEVRVLAAGGIKRTDTSAAALGTVAGGYAAQALGNPWVYVVVASVSVVLLLLATNLLPDSKSPLEDEGEATHSQTKGMLMLISGRQTLPIILFVMLPSILAAGYNSFMFPLFSADLGIKTASINNLFVLGQIVVYMAIPLIEFAEAELDKWRVAWLAIVGLSAVFLLFSFNTTLVWAVVTIALVGVLCKCSDGWKALWPRSAEMMGLSTGLATGAMFSMRSILLIVQPLLLGFLLTVSDRMAVIVIGLVCAVCAIAFYLTTRHTSLAPQDDHALDLVSYGLELTEDETEQDHLEAMQHPGLPVQVQVADGSSDASEDDE